MPTIAFAQGVQPVKPVGSTLAPLYPNAFASADNVAAQTATAMHGLTFIWDGAAWDRWTGAVTQSGTWNIGTLTTITNPVTVTDGSGALNVIVDSLPTVTVTDGAGALNVIVDSGSITVSDGSGPLTVDGTVAVSNSFLLDATYTGRMPAGASPADNESNTNTALSRIGGFNFIYDGSTWDRWTGAVSQSGTWNIGTVTTLTGITNPVTVTDGAGALNVIVDSGSVSVSNSFLLDATYTGRMPAGASPADNESNTNTALSRIGTFNYVYDGSTWDRWTGAVTQAAGPWTSNVTQFGSSNIATGTGTGGAGIPRVTVSNDSKLQLWDGTLTASVRDTGTSDSLNVAIVDGSGNQITSFGGGTEYTEDIAAAADPVGKAVILVRKDTPAATVTTDGDNIAQRGTNYGAAYVQVVTSAGAFVDSFGGSGGTAQADRSSYTDGTTNMTPIGGCYNETNTDPTEDQAACVRITADRALHVSPRAADGTVLWPTAAALADDTANPTLTGIATYNMCYDGTTWDRCRGTTIDTDDGTIAGAQVTSLIIAENYVHDGSNWVRQSVLADDGAAAGTNRFGVLPGIAQSGFNSSTSGRNTALNTLAATGSLLVAPMPDMSLESYSGSGVVASAASATDIAILPGNATNTVLVTEVRVSCTQTTAGNVEVHLIKRSTANSAGTSTAMTEVPDDANYSAADSAGLFYTANPTTGSTVGDIDIVKLGCMATGTTVPNDLYIGNFRQKPIVLRGTAQGLAVNLNGVTVSGGSFAITYKWIEASGL